MSEVKHKVSTIFILFLLDAILAAMLIPALEVSTGIGYADSTIGAFLIFVIILVVGAASIGAYKVDRKYEVHKKVGRKLKSGTSKLHRKKHRKA